MYVCMYVYTHTRTYIGLYIYLFCCFEDVWWSPYIINKYIYICINSVYTYIHAYLFFIYGDHQTSSKQRKWSIKFKLGGRE